MTMEQFGSDEFEHADSASAGNSNAAAKRDFRKVNNCDGPLRAVPKPESILVCFTHPLFWGTSSEATVVRRSYQRRASRRLLILSKTLSKGPFARCRNGPNIGQNAIARTHFNLATLNAQEE